MGWGVSVTPRPLFTPGKDPVPIVQEAEWAPGPFWTGAKNLPSTGIRSPDRQERSQSLYRLSYPVRPVEALRLCTGRTAHRGSRVIALLFHDRSTRRAWGVSVTLLPLFTPGKDLVPIVQEDRWAPGPVWTGAENLGHTEIRSPDRQARSQSLYRLRYPAHNNLPCACNHNHTQYSVSDSNDPIFVTKKEGNDEIEDVPVGFEVKWVQQSL
jgi:hypothetical protein